MVSTIYVIKKYCLLTLFVHIIYIMNITLQQLATLDAVILHGSIQAAADALNKTHPSLIAAIKKLEDEIGFSLFDRSGYRSTLTTQGSEFHKRAKQILTQVNELKVQAHHISQGEEAELNIILGDITPIAEALAVLKSFSDQHPATRLNLFFENLTGPNEKLLAGKADLIIHFVRKSDSRYEYKEYCKVPIIPVATPKLVDGFNVKALAYRDLKNLTQCIIRDTATQQNTSNYFILEEAPKITVGGQHTKKEIILQGMAWGHMPFFLIENELNSGALISLESETLKRNTIDIVIARLQSKQRGPMAERLWQFFA